MKDLLGDFEIPESELRETLRKLDEAGLARRSKGAWWAVPLEIAEPEPSRASDAASSSASDS